MTPEGRLLRQFVGWLSGDIPENDDPIATLFELVIEHNARRGYRLRTFQLFQLMTGPDALTETIIAVFERLDLNGGTPDAPTT